MGVDDSTGGRETRSGPMAELQEVPILYTWVKDQELVEAVRILTQEIDRVHQVLKAVAQHLGETSRQSGTAEPASIPKPNKPSFVSA